MNPDRFTTLLHHPGIEPVHAVSAQGFPDAINSDAGYPVRVKGKEHSTGPALTIDQDEAHDYFTSENLAGSWLLPFPPPTELILPSSLSTLNT